MKSDEVTAGEPDKHGNVDDNPVNVTLTFKNQIEKERFFVGLADTWGQDHCFLTVSPEPEPEYFYEAFKNSTTFLVDVYPDDYDEEAQRQHRALVAEAKVRRQDV